MQALTSPTLAALAPALLAPVRLRLVKSTSLTSHSSMTTRWPRASSSPAWHTPPPTAPSPLTRRRPSTKLILPYDGLWVVVEVSGVNLQIVEMTLFSLSLETKLFFRDFFCACQCELYSSSIFVYDVCAWYIVKHPHREIDFFVERASDF